MTPAEIKVGRAHDDALKEAYFAKVSLPWRKRAVRSIKRKRAFKDA
jgi:hypothetical protein